MEYHAIYGYPISRRLSKPGSKANLQILPLQENRQLGELPKLHATIATRSTESVWKADRRTWDRTGSLPEGQTKRERIVSNEGQNFGPAVLLALVFSHVILAIARYIIIIEVLLHQRDFGGGR